jgi:hypothetical protein
MRRSILLHKYNLRDVNFFKIHGLDLRRYHSSHFVGKFLLKFHVVKNLNYGSQKRVTFVFISYGDKIRSKYIKN